MTAVKTAVPRSKSSTPRPKPVAPVRVQMTLKETQSLFQDAILNGDAEILDMLLDNSRTSRATLFGVYQNAYSGRLVEILSSDYEFLKAYCGDEMFGDLAHEYISANPSRSQNARWFGAKLPGFLSAHEIYSARPELADLAALEKALSDAFDATDAVTIAIADIAKYPPEDWGRLTFTRHPSATLLDVRTSAFALWKALKDEVPPPALAQIAPRHLIIWRQNTTPMVREMGAEEVMMWTEAGRGVRFDALCEMAATFDNPDEAAMRAAGYLQGWLSTDMLTSARLASERRVRARRRR